MIGSDFKDLVQQLSRKLYVYAFRILLNQEEAEDVVQEIFIKLWNIGEKLNDYKSIDALAFTMTKNYCIDLLRKKKLRYDVDLKTIDSMNLTSPSPYEQMENRESDEIIRKIIEQLPPIHKVMIKLRDIEGLSYEEIAEITNQNISTLRVAISRARKYIRDEYNKYQYERNGIKQIDRKVLSGGKH